MSVFTLLCLLLLIICNNGFHPRFKHFKTRPRRRLKGRGGGSRGGSRSSRSTSRSGTSHYRSYRSSATYYHSRASRATSEPDAQDYSIKFSLKYAFNSGKLAQYLNNNGTLKNPNISSNFTCSHTGLKTALEKVISDRRDTYSIYSAEDLSTVKNDISYVANVYSGTKDMVYKVQLMNTLSKKNKRAFEQWLKNEGNTAFTTAANAESSTQTATIVTISDATVSYTTKEEIGTAAILLIVFGILIACCCGFCCYIKRDEIGDKVGDCCAGSGGSSSTSYGGTSGGTTNDGPRIYDVNCPGGHGIVYFEDVAGYYDCNDCDYHGKRGDMLYGCRQCNFDLCQNCFNKRKGNTTDDINGETELAPAPPDTNDKDPDIPKDDVNVPKDVDPDATIVYS